MAFSFSSLFKQIGTSSGVVPQRVVGIDIGSAAIKVVELERRDQMIALHTYGELQLGPYADKQLGETVSLEPQEKIEALVDVIREARVSASLGVLAMPLASSFVTVIPVGISKGEDLTSKIRLEARKYIPIPLNEVTLDWSELPSQKGTKTNVVEVLLAAVQNEALEKYKQLMTSVDMKSQPSEIEVFSALRSLTANRTDAVAVIDLGARISKLYISRAGMLERIHRVSVGGSQITSRIAELLSVPFVEAENLKRNYQPEQATAADIKRAVTSTLTPALQEFKRIIDQYEARQDTPLADIILSGGTATFADLQAAVPDVLCRSVSISHPFERIAYPAFMEDTLKGIGPTFSVALGAALRHFEN